MNNNQPNFLIVGAAKSATTSFAKYLGKHSKIFVPNVKEPRYFVSETLRSNNRKDPLYSQIKKSSVLDKTEYYNLFRSNKELKGEASVHYLYHHLEAIPRIKSELGDIPIIMILRNPVDRAISNWMYIGADYFNFEKALSNEGKRIKNNYNSFWYYRQLGFYSDQVKAYLENFSKVKVILYDDIENDIQNVLHETFTFLGTHNEKIDTSIKYNTKKTYDSKINTFNRSLKIKRRVYNIAFFLKMDKLFFRARSKNISNLTLSSLNLEFKNDIICLEKIIERDLSTWLNKY